MRHSLLVLVPWLMVAGCAPAPAPSQPPSPAPAPITSTPAVDNHAAEAGVDAANPPPSLGSVLVGCQPGQPFRSVRIDVLGVQRRGQLAVATFSAVGTPNPDHVAQAADDVSVARLYRCNEGAFDPTLIDGANLLAYRPVGSGGVYGLRSNSLTTDISAQPVYLYAVFPAPKPGVSTIDVATGTGVVAEVTVS